MKPNSCLDLFFTFSRIGAFTFGGGYAMLPMLEKEVVAKKHWAAEDELLDYFAVGQCTPGVIAVNVSTFIGYKIKGLAGAVAATVGIIVPSFLIILVLAAFLNNFASNPYIQHALGGIRAAVAALIVTSVIKLWKSGVKGLLGILIFTAIFLLSIFLSLSPILIVAAAILCGIFYSFINKSRKSDKVGNGGEK